VPLCVDHVTLPSRTNRKVCSRQSACQFALIYEWRNQLCAKCSNLDFCGVGNKAKQLFRLWYNWEDLDVDGKYEVGS
jgi:hypothetical protein